MIAKKVLSWKPQGKMPLGKHKQRWFDKISKDLATLGVENYRKVVMDRERYIRKCVL